MSFISSSVHNHTTFCDGKSTPEEVLLQAIEEGLKTIGFSAHSYTPCDPSYCLRDTDAYFSELKKLKEKYADKIDVLIGLEVDCYGEYDSRADYVIVSVHNIKIGHKIYVVDYSKEELDRCIKEDFSGDALALVEAYYKTVEQSIEQGGDIIGHLDLVTKFEEQYPIIDQNSQRYINAVTRVLEKLKGKNIPLEVNTGCVSRGYKTKDFYPSTALLKIIKSYDIPLIITADSHHKDGIVSEFDSAVSRLKSIGFDHVVELTKDGFKRIDLV